MTIFSMGGDCVFLNKTMERFLVKMLIMLSFRNEITIAGLLLT